MRSRVEGERIRNNRRMIRDRQKREKEDRDGEIHIKLFNINN